MIFICFKKKSQLILGPPFLNAQECGKLKNVGKVGHERPTLLTITKGGQSSWRIVHEWYPISNMSSIMNSYVHWITFGGVELIHMHWNQWVHVPKQHPPTLVHRSKPSICCHLVKTIGLISLNGGTFCNKYAHGCMRDYCKCCTTQINSHNKHDLGPKCPWPVLACERPWHDQL